MIAYAFYRLDHWMISSCHSQGVSTLEVTANGPATLDLAPVMQATLWADIVYEAVSMSFGFVDKTGYRMTLANIGEMVEVFGLILGPDGKEIGRARLAETLGIAREAVSFKATTSEGLGFTGREEGIAAWAVATLRPTKGGPE